MLNRVKKAIDLMKQTRSVIYTNGEDFNKIIKKEGMIFGISKNGNNRVFFDGSKAKEWKIQTGGTLCNIYHMIGRTGENEVLRLVSADTNLVADLKTWLNIKGVKAKELSEVLNVSYQTVRSWIQHKNIPNVIVAMQTAKELGIDVTQIEW